ncbi:hypothetical protein yc1106_03189 [Curvularia clavata]|uniref:Prion-inhibition and propagation HeLo domain-containing protein n=1 Tax=Curvularia clavata TaxID=95742 RepID=A0A9Q8Z598_CURCL|nr:hypothetical protein yc1106_03189 [Curvularia clavata]
MTSLEIPAFIVGLSGLAAVFDKSCAIWRTIREAENFGEDVADRLRILEMEIFRFQTWWEALEKLAVQNPPVKSKTIPSTLLGSILANQLRDNLEHPITNAASQISKLLNDVQTILIDQGVLRATVGSQLFNAQAAQNPKTLDEDLENSHSRRRKLAKDLMTSISWWKRVQYDAKPWDESVKSALASKLQDIAYWNRALYDILPSRTRDSILSQGISAYILSDPQEASSVSKLKQDVVSETAKLLVSRRQLLGKSGDPPNTKQLAKVTLAQDKFGSVPTILPDSKVSFLDSGNQRFLVEWYPFPNHGGYSDYESILALAEERLKCLSLLLQEETKPSTLIALTSQGCFRCDSLRAFGLVSVLPPEISNTHSPILLHDLLQRKFEDPSTNSHFLPTLSQRFTIASSLASSLYTFMLARWHHKRFNSQSVLFTHMMESQLPDLTKPLVCGYSVSRPSHPEQISLLGPSDEEQDLYLHPDLRQNASTRPKYQREHEIYAFGLLLVEIGFWNTLARIATTKDQKAASRSGGDLRDFLIKKCTTEMACWMGSRFQDVTLRCLKAGHSYQQSCGFDKNDFYWDVVLELAEC